MANKRWSAVIIVALVLAAITGAWLLWTFTQEEIEIIPGAVWVYDVTIDGVPIPTMSYNYIILAENSSDEFQAWAPLYYEGRITGGSTVPFTVDSDLNRGSFTYYQPPHEVGDEWDWGNGPARVVSEEDVAGYDCMQIEYFFDEGDDPFSSRCHSEVLLNAAQIDLYADRSVVYTFREYEAGDSDGDLLPDQVEDNIGSDPNDADSDSDGYEDGNDVHPTKDIGVIITVTEFTTEGSGDQFSDSDVQLELRDTLDERGDLISETVVYSDASSVQIDWITAIDFDDSNFSLVGQANIGGYDRDQGDGPLETIDGDEQLDISAEGRLVLVLIIYFSSKSIEVDRLAILEDGANMDVTGDTQPGLTITVQADFTY